MSLTEHDSYMRQAIELATNSPKFPFGALITETETGKILAKGWNQSAANSTWHGEIVAINQLFELGHNSKDKSLTLYTTAEPCPMCQSAILWSEIETVVFGSSIPFLQRLGWRQIDIRAAEVAERTPFRQCNLIGGVLEGECNKLFVAAKELLEDH